MNKLSTGPIYSGHKCYLNAKLESPEYLP